MRISRRTLLGLGATGVVAVGAAGAGVATDVLPGRAKIGPYLGLDGDPVPMPTGPAGQVHYETFTSVHRPGQAEPWAWCTPPGTSIKGLPVVVVLHGYGDDHRTAFTQLGYAVFQHRVAQATGKPFVLATLDGQTSFWHKRANGDDWPRLVSDDLLSHLEALGADTSRLGMMGWSMGGYGALRLAENELHGRIKAIGAASTAAFTRYQDCPHPDAWDGEKDFDANTLEPRIQLLRDLPVHLACGVDDPWFDCSKRLVGELSPAPQTLFVKGNHNYYFWRRAAPVHMRYVVDRL